MTENLVNRLNVCGESSISGLCEDCIYDKHTAHPYNDNKSREKEILKCVHIDIWGPCQVQFAGDALYFMIIIDRFLSAAKVRWPKLSQLSLCSAFDKENSIESSLDSVHYLYNRNNPNPVLSSVLPYESTCSRASVITNLKEKKKKRKTIFKTKKKRKEKKY